MKITLLTHFKEFEKRSNTGRLVVDVLGNAAEQVCWDRMNPPPRLIEEIEAGRKQKLGTDKIKERAEQAKIEKRAQDFFYGKTGGL